MRQKRGWGGWKVVGNVEDITGQKMWIVLVTESRERKGDAGEAVFIIFLMAIFRQGNDSWWGQPFHAGGGLNTQFLTQIPRREKLVRHASWTKLRPQLFIVCALRSQTSAVSCQISCYIRWLRPAPLPPFPIPSSSFAVSPQIQLPSPPFPSLRSRTLHI